jgi:hypothetical protein
MGNTTSHTDITYYMIHHCQSCLESGKLINNTNNKDKFYINNLEQCQCNSCGSILNKSDLYKFLDTTN